MATHESVAYINRLGQLYYFFRGTKKNPSWFLEVVNEKDLATSIPSILALIPLRNKFTAHRQQDFSKKENKENDDCPNLGMHRYGLKHCLAGISGSTNVNITYDFLMIQRNELLKEYHPSSGVQGIEYFQDKYTIITFTPTKIHSEVLNQILSLLEKFFNFTNH